MKKGSKNMQICRKDNCPPSVLAIAIFGSFAVLLAPMPAQTAGGTAENQLPASVLSFAGVALLAPTNAQGGLCEISIRTGSSRYLISTNNLAPTVIQQCIRLHDKPVALKGEVSAQGKDLCLRIIGQIRDMTPSLAGVQLSVTVDANGKVTSARITTNDRKLDQQFTYDIALNKMTDEELKKIAALNGRIVNIDGEISQSTMKVTLRSPIRASALSGPPKPSSAKKKSSGR